MMGILLNKIRFPPNGSNIKIKWDAPDGSNIKIRWDDPDGSNIKIQLDYPYSNINIREAAKKVLLLMAGHFF